MNKNFEELDDLFNEKIFLLDEIINLESAAKSKVKTLAEYRKYKQNLSVLTDKLDKINIQIKTVNNKNIFS